MRVAKALKWFCFCLFVLSCWLLTARHIEFDVLSPFIALDPIWHIIHALSNKVFSKYFYLFILIFTLTFFVGRFFCYYLCPLGISLDIFNSVVKFLRNSKKYISDNNKRNIELASFFFIFVLICSIFRVNVEHFFSPTSISVAMYGLFLNPFLIASKGYINSFLHLFLLSIPFVLDIKDHRFWCKNICPTGWLLGIISSTGPMRGRIEQDSCIRCLKCLRVCPMDAIGSGGGLEKAFDINKNCHLCLKCTQQCTEGSIWFQWGFKNLEVSASGRERRQLILGALMGSLVSLIAIRPGSYRGEYKKAIVPRIMIRPPGALPEEHFEIRCIRCGLCMAVCPSNILQPMGFQNGLLSVYSPVMVPRFGPCYPDCNLCGRFCPTGAVRELSVLEKQWAKVGTAVIHKESCIAYEWGKSCLICDEACPFDAITMVRDTDKTVLVPIVEETRCNGCGACEAACPVIPEKAIQVKAMGEIRLAEGSYMEEGKRLGLQLGQKVKGIAEGNGIPPGFAD